MGNNIYNDYTVDQGTGTVTNGIGYIPGIGFDDPALADSPAYLGSDLIGTTRRVVDSSTGGQGGTGVSPVIQRTILTAFGEPLLPSPPEGEGQGEGGTGNTRYGYAGAWGYEEPEGSFDPLTELGWLHVGERYYDPAIGRFMQRDPIGIRGGLNCYVYASNRPTNTVDPSGLTVIVLHWREGGGRGVGHTALYSSETGAYVSFVPCGGASYLNRTISDDFEKYGIPTDLWVFDGLDEQGIADFDCRNEGDTWSVFDNNCIHATNEALNAGGVPDPGGVWHPPGMRDRLDKLAEELGGGHL